MGKGTIVSSDKEFIENLGCRLPGFGMDVSSLELPEDLLKKLLTDPPDIIFLDYSEDFVRRYNSARAKFAGIKPIPILIFSGQGFVFDMLGKFREDIIDYLPRFPDERYLAVVMKRAGYESVPPGPAAFAPASVPQPVSQRPGEKGKQESFEGSQGVITAVPEATASGIDVLEGLLKGRSVLIADDEAENREFIKVILKGKAAVTEAVDGEDAKIKVRKKLPDFLISDTVMPGLNGFQLVKIIREMDKTGKTKIIITSPRDKDKNTFENIQNRAGMVFLKKPFTENMFVQAIFSLFSVENK